MVVFKNQLPKEKKHDVINLALLRARRMISNRTFFFSEKLAFAFDVVLTHQLMALSLHVTKCTKTHYELKYRD